MSNGKLKPNELSPIIGGGKLRNDAADAWNAFANYCKQVHKQNVQVSDSYRVLGKKGDLSRGNWSQWAAWERYQNGGNLAAKPGTSNHGWGLAVDVPYNTQQLIASHGQQFGWSKKWSDAPGEPWHFKWKAGNYAGVSKWRADATLQQGDNGPATVALKKLLKKHGFWPRIFPINSGFGRLTTNQVKKFQKSRNLTDDGIVGPATWKALRAAVPVPVKPKPVPPKPKPPAKPNVKPTKVNKYFADIFNGTPVFNAKQYKAAGHSLIVLKASEGKTFKDALYVDRVKQARDAGLIVYSYHFARPSNNSARDEAKNFCERVKKAGVRPSDRLVLDWEDPKFTKNGDAWISSFIDEVAKQGLKIRIIYSGGWYVPGTMSKWPKDQDGIPLKYWHANYSSKPESNIPDIAKGHLWAVQFTDGENGPEPRSCAGIGKCDVNYLK